MLLASLWQNICGEKHTNISTNRKLYKFVLLLCGQVDHMNPGRILKLIVVIVSIYVFRVQVTRGILLVHDSPFNRPCFALETRGKYDAL